MKTLIEAFNGLDYVSYAIGLLTSFVVLLIRDLFLELVGTGRRKRNETK